uniref:Uncharacterized protein n=1 Tax=Trichogramma kaykai TaxID=54128 RepID=A0ABD2W794_9HYME
MSHVKTIAGLGNFYRSYNFVYLIVTYGKGISFAVFHCIFIEFRMNYELLRQVFLGVWIADLIGTGVNFDLVYLLTVILDQFR